MSRWSRYYNNMASRLTRTLGEPATYVPVGGEPYGLRGIFDPFYQAVEPDTGAIVISRQPTIYVKEADLKSKPQNGDKITVRGKTYRIVEPDVDGQGGYHFRLHA